MILRGTNYSNEVSSDVYIDYDDDAREFTILAGEYYDESDPETVVPIGSSFKYGSHRMDDNPHWEKVISIEYAGIHRIDHG